jgi:PAS domain S-box-containing protein
MASLLGVPLLVEDRLLGVMHVDSATPRHFTQDELHLLQLVADRVALALDNARLYDVAQRAHAAAEAERHHLHDLVMQAPAIICVLRGPEHVFEVANALYLQAVGRHTPQELVGRPVRAALPEVGGQGYFELLDQVYTTGEPFVGTEMPVKLDRRGDGTLEEILVNFVYQPYRNPDGAVEGIMVHAVDVTEQVRARQRTEELARQLQAERDRLAAEVAARIQAEEALRASEARYRAIVETANEGVWLIDPQGQTLFANARLAEMLGTTIDVVLARTVLDFVFVEDRPLAHERIGQNLAGVPEQFNFRFRRTDGTAVEVLACTSPVRTAGGTIVGALGMFSDITALRQLERAREEFLSSAAHDLKNPLTSIRGQAQLAQRSLARLELPEKVPLLGPLTQIVQSADVMVSLINELMDVTRQQMGAVLDVQRVPTDLVALVQDCIEAHRAASSRTIHLEVDEPELYAEVDAARMERVVGNLLSNALKYSPAERPIWVRLGRGEGTAGPEVVLVVRDEGIGIPAADLPHIFERFYRAENVAGRVAGTGIGLAGARQIAEQHGGTITVQSEEGVGSTFTVRLPLDAPDAKAQVTTAEDDRGRSA